MYFPSRWFSPRYWASRYFASAAGEAGFEWVLREVGAHLIARGRGVLGTDLFYGECPPLPINATTLYEERGRRGTESFGGAEWELAEVTVALRDSDYATGRLRIELIYRDLLAVANESLGLGTNYQRVDVVTSPYWDGNDEHGNPVFVLDIECAKRLSA